MPLSEHEQRLLEQMERQLYADDPKLASTLRGGATGAHNRRKLVGGVVGILVGLGLLLAGVALPAMILGVVGFLVMLGGGYLLTSGWQGRTTSTSPTNGGSKPSTAKTSRPGFMSRIEDRWDRRRDGDDR